MMPYTLYTRVVQLPALVRRLSKVLQHEHLEQIASAGRQVAGTVTPKLEINKHEAHERRGRTCSHFQPLDSLGESWPFATSKTRRRVENSRPRTMGGLRIEREKSISRILSRSRQGQLQHRRAYI